VSHRKLAVVVGGAAALTLTATALAITPKPALYHVPGWGEGEGGFTVANGHIKKNGSAPSKFGCQVGTQIATSIPISHGAFRYSGRPSRGAGHIVFAGHWVTASKVKGSTTLSKGSCKKTVTWTAVPFVQPTAPASPQVNAPAVDNTTDGGY
jgi:hypothetical protein